MAVDTLLEKQRIVGCIQSPGRGQSSYRTPSLRIKVHNPARAHIHSIELEPGTTSHFHYVDQRCYAAAKTVKNSDIPYIA